MPLPHVSHKDVLSAVDEFDRRGRDYVLGELASYGFRQSRDYFVNYRGSMYDSKPLLALASRVGLGETPLDSDFDGGDTQTAALFRRLGFLVTGPGPDWSYDETVLACDLLVRNSWHELRKDDSRIQHLSAVLRRSSNIEQELQSPRFRGIGSISRKIADLATSRAGYTGKSTHASAQDRDVTEAFLRDPEALHALAAELRAVLESESRAEPVPDVDAEDDAGSTEGRRLERRHYARERNPRLRRRKIEATRAADLPIACETCGFSFLDTYGERGVDYIEVHHRTPLHISGEVRTRLVDLALLCSNCHRMVHRRRPWLSVEEVALLVDEGRASNRSGGSSR